MSCSACTKICTGDLQVQPHDTPPHSPEGVRPHHTEINDLCNAALSGCRICIDLWRFFFKEKSPEQYAEAPWFEGEVTVHLYLGSGSKYRFLEPSLGLAPDNGSLVLEFILNSPMITGVDRKRFVLEKDDHCEKELLKLQQTSSGFMNMLDVNKDSFEEKRWNLIHTWINTCSSSHSRCKQRFSSAHPRYFPTRVIHVPFGPMKQEPHYPLIDTTSQSPTWLGNKYVTLSHCWGKAADPPYRTTRTNLASRLTSGIDRHDLPPTFTDAIDATLRLRCPFLWIDSLCIIQNDATDWSIECTKMASVYTNSHLNISATSASSSQDGLTSTHEAHPRILKTTWQDGKAGTYRIIDLDFWLERITDAEVNSRGWVLQERCLAPRVLHFAFDQVVWECCELAASEEFPAGIPSRYKEMSGHSDFKHETQFLPPTYIQEVVIPLDKRESVYRITHGIWQKLGTMYGRCELTVPDNDKLMAISALALVVSRSLNDTYLAGLWRKNLIGDLLWKVDKTRRLIRGTVPDGMYQKRWDYSRRGEAYRAPSWSWASVDGLVQFGTFTDLCFGRKERVQDGDSDFEVVKRPLVHVLDVNAELVNSEYPFGQVQDGKLLVRGQLHGLGTTPDFPSPRLVFRTDGEIAFDHIDEPVDWEVYEKAYFLPLIVEEKRWKVMPRPLTERDKTTDKVAGIEICPTEDRKAFRRIGYMEVSLKRFRKLGGYILLPDEDIDDLFGSSKYVCRPDLAATGGNMVTGIFEIV